MKTLIIYESLFGNTARVAEAIAAGLHSAGRPVDVMTTDTAPNVIAEDVSLLVLGGPTHALGMTRPSTRTDAVGKGAGHAVQTGMREWIEGVTARPELLVITFDTRIKVRLLPGSAAKSAIKTLRDKGFRRADRGETFWVEDTDGPLKPGEVERATEWGASLADRTTQAP